MSDSSATRRWATSGNGVHASRRAPTVATTTAAATAAAATAAATARRGGTRNGRHAFASSTKAATAGSGVQQRRRTEVQDAALRQLCGAAALPAGRQLHLRARRGGAEHADARAEQRDRVNELLSKTRIRRTGAPRRLPVGQPMLFCPWCRAPRRGRRRAEAGLPLPQALLRLSLLADAVRPRDPAGRSHRNPARRRRRRGRGGVPAGGGGGRGRRGGACGCG